MNELEIYERKELLPEDVFCKGTSQELVNKIKTEARSFVIDATTAKGRKEAVTLAAKVRKSKTFLDTLGKNLTESERDKITKVNAERKIIRDELDELAEEIRKPVTEFEQAEENRIAAIRIRITDIEVACEGLETLEQMYLKKDELEKVNVGSFAEFAIEAEDKKTNAINLITQKIETAEKLQAQEKELAELRALKEKADAEKAELERITEQKAHDEAIKEQAERQAKIDADAEKARVENEKIEAQRKADEAVRIAKEEAEKAKADAIAELEAEKQKLKDEAEAKAKKEADEKERLAAEEKAKQENTELINKAAYESVDDLCKLGFDKETANKIVGYIKNNFVVHLSFSF